MEGKLNHSMIGRWEILDELGKRFEITSGEVIEVKIADYWIRTRIEHGSGYYACVLGIQLCNGLPARTVEK